MDEFDDAAEPEPLDDQDREQLQQDLIDVQVLTDLLGSKEIKGVVFYCPDCGEDHYLTWDLLAGNLKSMLDEGQSPVHEPAFAPNPDDYVSWDYARGYLDGYETFEEEELTELALRLVSALRRRGMSDEEIPPFLTEMGIDLHVVDDRPEAGSSP